MKQLKQKVLLRNLEEAQTKYQERVEKLKKRQSDFKQEYKAQIETYKKVVQLRKDGLSGNISEESTFIRIKEEFEKFKELDLALQKYKVDTVNALLERKQSLLQTITDVLMIDF